MGGPRDPRPPGYFAFSQGPEGTLGSHASVAGGGGKFSGHIKGPGALASWMGLGPHVFTSREFSSYPA